jgi:hypothetical protein
MRGGVDVDESRAGVNRPELHPLAFHQLVPPGILKVISLKAVAPDNSDGDEVNFLICSK